MVRVTGGWARHGKEPNSFQDYGVLECAGAFSATDYAAILERYAVGNPPLEKTGEEALPWITLSEVQDDHHSYLGVSVKSWTDEVDGAGRPIVQTLYGCFPYPQFTRTPVSYRELAAVVERLGPGGLDPAGVEVPGYAPEEIERDLQRKGWFQRAVVAAAMLLEGPVTITGAGGLGVDERLRFLDAVAALLPYGWRTRFTASTWFRGGGPYIQLAFARHSRGQGYDLDWWTEPVQLPPTRFRVAHAYLEEWRELIDRRSFGWRDLVAFLSRQTEPLAGADPYRAVEVLQEFDRPGTVLQRARQGSVEADELARLFESGRYTDLPRPQDQVFLLGEWIRLGGPVKPEIIAQVCRPVGGAAPIVQKQVWPGLADRAYHQVWDGAPGDGRVGSYLTMARCLGRDDELLARLLEPPPSAVLEIVDERVAALGVLVARWADPEGAPMPRTMAALQRSPILACALITGLNADAPDRLPAWIGALTQVMPGDLLRPFERLLREPVLPLTAGELAGVARYGENCVSALLWLATDRGRLSRVVQAFVEWLATLPDAARPPWADRLATLVPDGGEDRALVDVLLLRTGAAPVHLETTAGQEWNAYLTAFRRNVLLNGWLNPALREAQAGMVRYLGRSNWTADRQRARAVLQVTEALCEVRGENWSDLVRTVMRGRATSPGMVDLPEYQGWWQKVEKTYPWLAQEQYMTVLEALPPGARPEEIGRLAAEALWNGKPAHMVLTWITNSRADPDGRIMLEVVEEVRRELRRLGMRPREAADKAIELARLLSDGQRHNGAQSFRTAVADRAEEELVFRFRLLQAASTVPPGHTEVELSDTAKEALDVAMSWIRTLQSKRRFRRG